MTPSHLAILGIFAMATFSAGPLRGNSHSIVRDLPVTMRDGVSLSTTLYLPGSDPNTSHPALLTRTPYGKDEASDDALGARLAKEGYAVIVQDVRGNGQSDGDWKPWTSEIADGEDTVDWIHQQEWFNGRLGTFGPSYLGWAQWALAPGSKGKLAAMAPQVAFYDAYGKAYQNGVFQPALSWMWGAWQGGVSISDHELVQGMNHFPQKEWHTTLSPRLDYLATWLEHPSFDDYWKQRSVKHRLKEIDSPVLAIGGWYDIFGNDTLSAVRTLRENAASEKERDRYIAIMGPWIHKTGTRQIGEIDFGPNAAVDLDAIEMSWMDYWLKDDLNDVPSWPAYNIFVMGKNQWRGEDHWPIERTIHTPFYLSSNGKANHDQADGTLSTEIPVPNDLVDTYSFDPLDPVPTIGGNMFSGGSGGPYDQRKIENRNDVLSFTTAPLETGIEVTGAIEVHLFAASSAGDTDFTAKLVDVHPDGRAINITEGIVRARYRNGVDKESLIEANSIYQYKLELWPTSNYFKPGHRIRLDISSSNYPRFDVNPNSAKAYGTESAPRIAQQTIYHSESYPSKIVLPIIPPSATEENPNGTKAIRPYLSPTENSLSCSEKR